MPKPNKKGKYCLSCGHTGLGKYRGSLMVTLVLLCFAIVPGLLYEFWRMWYGDAKCGNCAKITLVPMNSPAAINQRLMYQMMERQQKNRDN